MAGVRGFTGDVFKVGYTEAADTAAAKYRLWVGGGTKRIHIVKLELGSYGSSASTNVGIRRAPAATITFTAGVAQVPVNGNDGGPVVPGGVLCYVTAGANGMAASGTPDNFGDISLPSSGQVQVLEFFKGQLSVAPGNYLGILQSSYGSNTGSQCVIWFTVEP